MSFGNPSQQRGITLISMVLVGIVIAVVGALTAKIVPTVSEYYTVLRAANKAKAGATVSEVKEIFDRQVSIEQVVSVTSKDLEVSKADNDEVVVAFAYEREIHLVGPAWLVMKYSGRTK
jgi:Tfp pilus assembly protein PilE